MLYFFIDSTPMPFGRHKGKPMREVPAHYLLYLFNQGCKHPGVKQYINDNLADLNKAVSFTKKVSK